VAENHAGETLLIFLIGFTAFLCSCSILPKGKLQLLHHQLRKVNGSTARRFVIGISEEEKQFLDNK